MLEKRQYDNIIDNISCLNTKHRLINQIIMKEFIFSHWKKDLKNWEKRASKRLRDNFSIKIQPSTLKSRLYGIRNRQINPICASDFSQGVSYESIPASRYGKDSMQLAFNVLINSFLTTRKLKYVGLPANQLAYYSSLYHKVRACEINEDMMKYMKALNKLIIRQNNVHVINKNIFEYLNNTREKFNIYDFDLMLAINLDIIDKIAYSVNRTMENTAIISITSIGGRHITTKQYNELMPSLLVEKLESLGLNIINNPFSGAYRDIKMPMRYEFLVIERKI